MNVIGCLVFDISIRILKCVITRNVYLWAHACVCVYVFVCVCVPVCLCACVCMLCCFVLFCCFSSCLKMKFFDVIQIFVLQMVGSTKPDSYPKARECAAMRERLHALRRSALHGVRVCDVAVRVAAEAARLLQVFFLFSSLWNWVRLFFFLSLLSYKFRVHMSDLDKAYAIYFCLFVLFFFTIVRNGMGKI